MVKKEENVNWLPANASRPKPLDAASTREGSASGENSLPVTTSTPTVSMERIKLPKALIHPVLSPSGTQTKKRQFSPPSEVKIEDMSYTSEAAAAATLLMATAACSSPTTLEEVSPEDSSLHNITCEEESSSSSSPSVESEREQTPPLTEEEKHGPGKKSRRSSSIQVSQDSGMEESSGGEGQESKRTRREDLDFSIDMGK